METIEIFKAKQTKTIDILNRLREFLKEGAQFDLNLDNQFIEKIETAIETTKAQKLKVALIGGFSEGKTSIAAAWSEKYDKEAMKINQAESSDEVKIFDLKDFQLIDTPGLFGFKETANKEKYKDITKKYISEANIILYVMNSNNPIKESHKEDLTWLFKDLNLLNRTVFVLSRFDEEADVADADEYADRFAIKKANVTKRLLDFEIIGRDEDVSIVAVAANPFDMGIDYWLDNMQQYQEISHIKDLQAATAKKIKDTNPSKLILETQKTVVKDILIKQLPSVKSKIIAADKGLKNFDSAFKDLKRQKEDAELKIQDTQLGMKDFIMTYFSGLIMQAKGSNQETFVDFMERNIGDKGIILDTKLNNELQRQTGTVTGVLSQMQLSYESGIEHYQNIVGEVAFSALKETSKFLSQGTSLVSGANVLAIRDVIFPSFKFKPWGALKLAEGTSTALGVIGAGVGLILEAVDSINKQQQQDQFNEVLNATISNLKQQMKEYLELIKDNQRFIDVFFPNLHQLFALVDEAELQFATSDQEYKNLLQWQKQGKTIEAEFEEID